MTKHGTFSQAPSRVSWSSACTATLPPKAHRQKRACVLATAPLARLWSVKSMSLTTGHAHAQQGLSTRGTPRQGSLGALEHVSRWRALRRAVAVTSEVG
jgi:hypothetical protein